MNDQTLPLPLDEPRRLGCDPTLSIESAAVVSGIPERTLRHNCGNGALAGAKKDAVSGSWTIPLSSLSHLAQARYWSNHAAVAPGGWDAGERRALPQEEVSELWRRFEAQTAKLKRKALQDREACLFWQLMKAHGVHYTEALKEIKEAFGMGKSTIYDKLKLIRGYDPDLWPALLIGQWDGRNAKTVVWPEFAFHYFMRQALVPGAKVKTAWKRTVRQAEKEGWGKVPSYDTALADFRKLPADVVTLALKGETALKARAPSVRRAYDMPLHEVWSLDGRRKDLMVVDTQGKLGPPGKVFRLWILAIEEIRARYLVGYAIGAALNADLVRAAFLDALRRTGRIIPRTIQMDNGMENAAKEITGGAPWRRRGKVLEGEIIGLFPMLGIDVSWATPAHGQTKPVERLFGTLAGMVETRPEFRGAYCGNSPDARPEEWDASKAVPLEVVEALLREEIGAYHQTPHRGHGMQGRSPYQVYVEEGAKPGVVLRRITEPQERMCALSAAPVTIRKNDGGFTLHGAFCYSEETARLAPGKGYYVRYNPGDLSDTLYVYRGEKLLCTARKVERTGWNDKASAKATVKARRNYMKKVKEQAEALQALRNTDTPEFMKAIRAEVEGERVDPETGEILPAGKVLEMVKTAAQVPQSEQTKEQVDEDAELESLRKLAAGSAFDRALARKKVGG